jgi:hypothetical protein
MTRGRTPPPAGLHLFKEVRRDEWFLFARVLLPLVNDDPLIEPTVEDIFQRMRGEEIACFRPETLVVKQQGDLTV